MNAFQPLPWHAEIWAALTRARGQNQLAHAWLISGQPGVGKKRLAGALVAALLCERTQPGGETGKQAGGIACGDCNSCRMLLSGGHPDAHLLSLDGHLGLAMQPDLLRKDGITHWEPDKSSKRSEIAINGVRSLIDKLTVFSHCGGHKVAVIVPAEELSRSSADALLKTIEEPTPNTFLILIADQGMSLSATLRSRCQQLRLGLPPVAAAQAWLQEQLPQTDPASRDAALQLARGAPLRAMARLAADEPSPELAWRAALDEAAQGRGDMLKLAASIDDETAIAFLHCCQGWLAERLRTELASGPRLPGRNVAELANELHDAHRRLAANTRPQLVMEAMLIGWVRLLAPAPKSAGDTRLATAR